MPIWTDTTARATMPRPLGNQAHTRAAFIEFQNDLDTKAAFISIANTFSAAQTFNADVTIGPSADLILSKPASRLRPGATSFAVRNNADNADNLLVGDAGMVTVRSGLTVTAGGATVSAGGANVTGGLIADTLRTLSYEDLLNIATPAAPPAGYTRIFSDANGLMFRLSSSGILSSIGGGGDETVTFSFGRAF